MVLGFSTKILAEVPMPLVLIEENEHIGFVNPQATELFGAGLVGRHYSTILRQPSVLEAIQGALMNEKPKTARFQNRVGDQEIFYDVKCALIVEGRSQKHVLVSFEDVSQLHEADQMRSDFVANVSHELRSPLTSLLGFIETLRGSARDDTETRERFLSIMEREASRMTRLVRDLLSLSRVESEERVRPNGTVDIRGVIVSCVQTLEPLAEKSGTTIRLSQKGDEASLVIGDADQLRQVFINILENSIKYSAQGEDINVEITPKEYDVALRGQAIRIVLSDVGDGIDQIHIPRLTERFYRIDSHRSREMGGTGLGLAIVKHIVSRHRGRFRITSKKGQGSQFIVILPAA